MGATTTHVETEGGREAQEAVDRAVSGTRDREAARRALERLTREREEIRKRLGTLDVVVDLVREARNPHDP